MRSKETRPGGEFRVRPSDMADETIQVDTPAAEDRQYGWVATLDVLVSEAERWVEDGVHVIRSTEFDVVAGDLDFDRAVDQFVDKAEDLWTYLSELDGLTENENETYLRLAPRFHQIYKELERRENERRRRLIILNLRRRGAHLRGWHSASTPERSSQALPA